MRILVTADFQADYQNLELCQQAWDEVISICAKESIGHVVVAGDLKQLYNPVDARVIKWWFNAIKQARDRNVVVYCNLGNHDRLGLYVSTENWFPILRKAGAQCFDKPSTVQIDGWDIAFLPYRNSSKVIREFADELAAKVGKKSILIFHGEIAGAKYNQFGSTTEHGIKADWLHADRYSYVLGGHFHLQQKIGENIYYCGSPFAQDWGEANQKKGYFITDGTTLRSVPSSIPGWFDPTWPGFYEPSSWQGTRVRLHVECRSSLEYVPAVERARSNGQDQYPGAEINVSATIRTGRDQEEVKLSATDPDAVKIKEYVAQTCPENVEPHKVIKYLESKVAEQSGKWQRMGTGVSFLKAKAENFLSFKSVAIDWKQNGIVVVQGQNNDRKGKSNGSGKTSLLQTIPVALFGSTFKGQKHDKWAKRGCEASASVTLILRDGKNRIIKIHRSRKPAKLRLWVDGKEQSTGMKPQDKEGTQSLIEKLTGFTWQTLANAVYIDQKVAYEFVAGTKKSRTDLLARLQNLERFTKALEVVKKDRAKAEVWARQVEESITVIDERIEGYKAKLSLLIEESANRVQEAWQELEERRKAKEQHDGLVAPAIKSLDKKLAQAETVFEAAKDAAEQMEMALNMWKVKREVVLKQKPEVDALSQTCPACKQPITKEHIHAVQKQIKSDLQKLQAPIRESQERYTKALQSTQAAESECEKLGMERNKLADAAKRLEIALNECERGYLELKKREHNESDLRQDVKSQLKAAIAQKKSLEQHQVMHRKEMGFYQYCEKALSRDGIPAFLNALLCSPLNTAAEYYSEVFADKSLQVRFELDDGEFIPVILNATGGESIDDQSDGERALAGLIASFALRETTPTCNLLILDEPGHGLDPSAARQFAKGLRGLLSKFESIWLTTHNQIIASELMDQSVITVEKSNGVSSIQ